MRIYYEQRKLDRRTGGLEKEEVCRGLVPSISSGPLGMVGREPYEV